MEGRGFGTKGLDRAAEFIAAQLAERGLKDKLFAGTPYQKLSVPGAAKKGPGRRGWKAD